jgi:acyl-CoA reductase-like NAD-dependent aldehyde dehydrogenase
MPDQALNSWIGGRAAGLADSGSSIQLTSPWSGEPAGSVHAAGQIGVEAAVSSAQKAFDINRGASAGDRAAWLRGAADEVERIADDIVYSATYVIGKPRKAARFEVQRSAEFIRACASHLPELGGDVIPLDAARSGIGLFGFTQRVPYGVVGAVTPFNAPANLLLQKVAPALAVGNAAVVKPAPEGTAIALMIAECFTKAGLPDGLLNVIAGGAEEARFLAAHSGVALVTVTGGTAAGSALAAAAGAKPFIGELGGNSANIVCRDADLEDAAARIARSAFEASGQQCISAQRVIVEEAVLDEFVPLFVEAAAALKVGEPSLETTDIGPVVNARAAERIMDMVAEAMETGAASILAPRRDGCVISPAILLARDMTCRAISEEIFGPVAVVIPVADLSEALRVANASQYGLQSACFTTSLETAFRASREIRSGSIWINEGSRFRLDNYPFGGVGASGFGREGVRYAMEAFTQWRFTGIRLPETGGGR